MSMICGRKFPQGWCLSTLGDVCHPSQYGWTTSAAHEGKILLLRTTDISSGDVNWAKVPFCEESPADVTKYLLQNGDLLISRAGSVGKSFLVTNPPTSVFASYLIRFRTLINSKFVYYFLQTADYWKQISDYTAGIATPNVNASKLTQLQIPIAPEGEQARIADALDELFSDLDAAVAALERVREKLKLYRASVLKASVEGTLTAEWRAKNPQAEPASELLKRILVERRRRWEEDQLAKFKAKDQAPPKNWKAKYKEPATPATTNLPTVPEGWQWVSLSQIAWAAGYGTSEKCRTTNTGLPVLRIPNIAKGRLNLEDLKFAAPEYCENDEELVNLGDLLIVRTNGSRNLIGRGAIVRDQQIDRFSFASYLIRFRIVPDESLLHWISIVWDSFHVRHWIEERAATSAGQYNISLGVLDSLVIPLPPAVEQKEITENAEDQFSVIDHLESDIEAKLKAAQALRQSILHHAFTGRLVPQDPKDEPASELLKRIAAERAARAKEVVAAKRPLKKSPATSRGRRSKQQQQGER